MRPDAPEPPKPDRITKDSVTLSWRPPRSDGGAKIRGYFVQIKQRGQDEWDDVNGAPIPTNVYTVPKLNEGEEYLFRVVAVNDVGRSDPSKPSNPIVIEEQPNKPVMDLGGVRDITVRAGEDFSIHVPYIGFPKPVATWYANDVVKDETDSRVHQQLGDDYARYDCQVLNCVTIELRIFMQIHSCTLKFPTNASESTKMHMIHKNMNFQ